MNHKNTHTYPIKTPLFPRAETPKPLPPGQVHWLLRDVLEEPRQLWRKARKELMLWPKWPPHGKLLDI